MITSTIRYDTITFEANREVTGDEDPVLVTPGGERSARYDVWINERD